MSEPTSDQIDDQGFRANVGMVICNDQSLLFMGKRFGSEQWQFPQGGIQRGEALDMALFRELHEEVGLAPDLVKIVLRTQNWMHYRMPLWNKRRDKKCIGQKQKWFLLRLMGDDAQIDIGHHQEAEFESWQWVKPQEAIERVVWFKQPIYEKVLQDFRPHI